MRSENEFAEFWIQDDIVHFIYKKDVNIDLEGAKKIVADRLKLQEGIPYLIYCDFRGPRDTTKEARDYLANEGSALSKGVAVLVGSPMTRMMVNFYLKINKPLVPTRMFTDKQNALEFVMALREKAVH